MERLSCGDLELVYQTGKIMMRLGDLPVMEREQPLFELWLEGLGHADATQRQADTRRCQGADWELLELTWSQDFWSTRISLLSSSGELRVSYTLSADWPDGIPGRAELHLPWLAALRLKDGVERFPAKIYAKQSGASALQMKKLCPPPFCLEMPDGHGVAAYFPLDAANLTWDPCRNVELCDVASRRQMEEHRLHLRLSDSPVLAADICLWPLRDGWRECFTRFRGVIRARVPQSQYQRQDLRWMREIGLVHFTYAFGREFFDDKANRPDLSRLLAAGEAFGGYDALLLWHEYPRLGLDERTQWDFYDDYPGGKACLKALIGAAHERGVRVLLPFKPWDRSPTENDQQTTRRIASLVKELDIDGIFFDTMNTVPEAFRAAMDEARPGVVFVTESEPHETRALEMITSSWNQYRTDWSMPESNLMRFLFPLHTRHAISRWHMGAQKDIAIQRAVFNGEGMVIWQDVFGAWLPYSDQQKAEIARWKALHRQYLPILETEDCVPLMTTTSASIAANGFFVGSQAVVTLYLDADEPFEGALMQRLHYASAVDLWSAQPMSMRDGTLHGRLLPGKTAFVLLSGTET